MKRTAPKPAGHFRPRAAITSGAALGLVVGATVYGAVSSSADVQVAQKPQAKAPVAVAPVLATGCTGAAKLENGICVLHVVRTVLAPPPAAAPAAPIAGKVPATTVRAGTPAGGSAVTPKAAVIPKAAAKAVAAPTKTAVAAAAPAPRPSPTTAPVPGTTPSPTPTPVPTAAS